VPYKELPNLLCSADLHILFQKENVIDAVMPSKLLGMMASAKPSLISGNPKSEVYRVLLESKGGKFFKPMELSQIIKFIKELKNHKELIPFYGQNARKYVIEHFSKEKVLKRFKNKIEEILRG
jgi:colanic acid biosynthesis glycosyl transferase WcaI